MTRHARYLWLFIASSFFILLFCDSAFARTWKDTTGKFSVEADFVSLDSGVVMLKKADGSTISLPLEKLCKEDQDLAKQLAAGSHNDNPFNKAKTIAPAESKAISATQIAGENAIDLLAQVHLPDDAVQGNWTRTNDGIESDPNGRAILRLSGRPDGEYDFRISFTCKGKTDGVSQIVSFKGTSFAFCVGGYGNTVCGFAAVGGRGLDNNSTTYRSGITTDRRHVVVVKVRNDSVTGYLDGLKISGLKTDYSNIAHAFGMQVGPGNLGVSTSHSQTVFHSIEVIPTESIRTWTDNAGKHSIEADFVSLDSGTVTLKKADGDTINLPLEKLSSADQDFAKSAAAKADSENPFASSAKSPKKQLIKGVGHAKAEPFTTKYIRLSLAVLEFGDCNLKIEETSAPMSSATNFVGETTTLDRFSNADILKSGDGSYRIIHSFDHSDPWDKIFFTFSTLGAERKGIDDTLWFKTEKDAGAGTMYWSRCQLPMIVCYDRLTIPNQSGLNLTLNSLKLGRLVVNLIKSKDGKTMLDIFWQDFGKSTQILRSAEVNPAKGFQHKFRLPLPNARIENVSQIQISASSEIPQKVEIAHLLVQGRLYPVTGMEFKEKSSVVFFSPIRPGSICEKAGLQEGDVVISLNGQEPKSAAELEDKTNTVPFGDELTFKIKRRDQEQEIKVVAE